MSKRNNDMLRGRNDEEDDPGQKRVKGNNKQKILEDFFTAI